jgi:hypothetical protein
VELTIEVTEKEAALIKYIKTINDIKTDSEAIAEAVDFYADKISHFEND